LDGVLGAVKRERLSVEEQLTLVCGVQPGDDLDQRRLACAVVSEQGKHLARADFEADVFERLNVAERLADPACLE
jgi:hypothetical protein